MRPKWLPRSRLGSGSEALARPAPLAVVSPDLGSPLSMAAAGWRTARRDAIRLASIIFLLCGGAVVTLLVAGGPDAVTTSARLFEQKEQLAAQTPRGQCASWKDHCYHAGCCIVTGGNCFLTIPCEEHLHGPGQGGITYKNQARSFHSDGFWAVSIGRIIATMLGAAVRPAAIAS